MKLKALLLMLFGITLVEAGTISRTDYTAGNSITAALQNANENTIINEINGALDSANIEDNTLTTSDILDATITTTDISASAGITVGQMSSTFQSSHTYTMMASTNVTAMSTYRRPNLVFVSVTTVDVEENTGTDNQTCIFFPGEPGQQRCVTENTGSTSVNRRFIITESASFSGTKNSGLSDTAEAANRWYALYAVKVTDNNTDFVIAGTTNTPSQGNYATLNTLFGTYGWVYLGLIRNGAGSAVTLDILTFTQAGNLSILKNDLTVFGTGEGDWTGVVLSSNADNTSTWTYSAGFSSAALPSPIQIAYFWGIGENVIDGCALSDSANGHNWAREGDEGKVTFKLNSWHPSSEGVTTGCSTATGETTATGVKGWIDSALSGSLAPPF